MHVENAGLDGRVTFAQALGSLRGILSRLDIQPWKPLGSFFLLSSPRAHSV